MDGIRKYQRSAKRHNYKSFVSAFAEEIVRNSNKTTQNNFLIIREFPVRSIGITESQRKSDVVIVEVVETNGEQERVILIIECKVKEEDVRSPKALRQLSSYLEDTGCTQGILMNVNTALIFEDHQNGELPVQVGSGLNLDNDRDIHELINYINNIK